MILVPLTKTRAYKLLMKTVLPCLFGKVLPGLSSILLLVTCYAQEPYRLVKEIPVGGPGGWDYLTVDSAAQRLYVSHDTKVVAIDLTTDTVAGEITNTLGVHGLAPAPDLGRGFVSCGRENKAAVVDLKTLRILSKIETGQNPDGMLYEPGRKEVYMFNGRSGSATVINAKAPAVVATIPLEGKPEFGQADPEAGRVYDNVEDKSEVVAIDTTTHHVVNRWPTAPGEEPSGMAIDVAHHRLFIGCGNRLMLMMDSGSGKVVGSVAIGEGVDANAFDPGTQLAFASCGDGTTTIAHEDSPEKLTVVQTLRTERGARTMTLDPSTHKIYLASAKFEAPAPGQRRGRVVPDSFKILVYGMNSATGQ
jgi:DNA-binding beta-propeller fold protein YncE